MGTACLRMEARILTAAEKKTKQDTAKIILWKHKIKTGMIEMSFKPSWSPFLFQGPPT